MNDRLKEPSSWGGIAVMLATGATLLPNDFSAFGFGSSEWSVVLSVGALACGVVAVWCREKGKEVKSDE